MSKASKVRGRAIKARAKASMVDKGKRGKGEGEARVSHESKLRLGKRG